MTALLKALAYVALIGACFLLVPKAAPAAAGVAQPLSFVALMGAVVISVQAVLFTYSGWDAPAYFAEENRDASRDLPRGMIAGVVGVIAIYLLVNLAFLAVLPASRIAGEAFAAGTVAGVIFGAWGDPVFRVLTIVSMLTKNESEVRS